jgi:hypothetical protein
MRMFLTIILLFIFKLSFTQIPTKKIISFINNKYSTVSDFLIENRWELKGIDTTGGPHSVWAHGYIASSNTADHWFYCFFNAFPKINNDSVYGIAYMGLSQQEFLQYNNDFPSLGFKNTKTIDFQGRLSVFYEKPVNNGKANGFISVELLQFTMSDSKSRTTKYQLTIGYLD